MDPIDFDVQPDPFHAKIEALTGRGLRRTLRTVASACGPTIRLEGRTVVLLASNDYLGLTTHPRLKQASLDAIQQYGVGAGASRLISGTLPPHTLLEQRLAQFKQTEAALVFGSGYLANLGLLPALIAKNGTIYADRLCHASLIEACRLTGAALRVYHHADPDHLIRLLGQRRSRHPAVIVTDGVFSMDGDIAPLPALVQIAQSYNATLLIDDAHGTGVMGTFGHGTLEHCAVSERVLFHMGTLSKALGTSGGFVVGPMSLIQFLINTAKSFIYTTAPPPATMAAAIAAIDVIEQEPDRRARLWDNREHFYRKLLAAGFRTTATVTPIIPILIGDPNRAKHLADRLLELGVYAPAIRPPTVPKGASRIRCTVTSEHTREQLDLALNALTQAATELHLL
jgi:glycine C-acetyltransferase/8-amino-7-oxononanoate synthase